VKLVKMLVKVLMVAGLAAGTLGGAAALGSTLWDAPPRDAAEFAERVEAGSVHLQPEPTSGETGALADQGHGETKQDKPKAKPGLRRTPAEQRYARALNGICVRAKDELRALGRPRSLVELEEYLNRALALWDRYEARFAASVPPARFRDEAAKMRDLDARGERLLRRTLRAARERDSYALLDLSDRLISLGLRENDLYSRMGAAQCATDLVPTY
jgi:hypothetical protein